MVLDKVSDTARRTLVADTVLGMSVLGRVQGTEPVLVSSVQGTVQLGLRLPVVPSPVPHRELLLCTELVSVLSMGLGHTSELLVKSSLAYQKV